MKRISAAAVAGLLAVFVVTITGSAQAIDNCWPRAEPSQHGVYVPAWSL